MLVMIVIYHNDSDPDLSSDHLGSVGVCLFKSDVDMKKMGRECNQETTKYVDGTRL